MARPGPADARRRGGGAVGGDHGNGVGASMRDIVRAGF
ncbi:hypothetical protein AZ78_2947 [Lysobacter capsici AZ78]|uniref:Uncharacterized protein n=1 Tax=Lysobacter capsici AZ78 TaxID=1444315 RepID=A0A108UA77_9GAMM|nr:hypothetical protein AZ78_2947 [Lysobacter capsici AZ78]